MEELSNTLFPVYSQGVMFTNLYTHYVEHKEPGIKPVLMRVLSLIRDGRSILTAGEGHARAEGECHCSRRVYKGKTVGTGGSKGQR